MNPNYARLLSKHPIGAIVWEGESLLDDKPIVVIATGLKLRPATERNRKIGNMIQAWILRQDLDPFEALKNGSDVSICGDCKMRPRGTLGAGRACYVQVWPYVHTIWEAYQRGSYKPLCDFEVSPFAGRFVRLGAYGDPAAVPMYVWEDVLKGAAGWTAYTHAWRSCDPELMKISMASVDTPQEYLQAKTAGWRCFRTRLASDEINQDEIMCPASKEAGQRLQCADCNLCSGLELRGKNIAIVSHGSGSSNYVRLRGSSNVRESALRVL